jgi:hypothetical protein
MFFVYRIFIKEQELWVWEMDETWVNVWAGNFYAPFRTIAKILKMGMHVLSFLHAIFYDQLCLLG